MSLELSHIFKEEETILQITMGILKKKLRAVKEKPRKKNYNEEKGEKPTWEWGSRMLKRMPLNSLVTFNQKSPNSSNAQRSRAFVKSQIGHNKAKNSPSS